MRFHDRCIYEYDAEHTIGGKGFLESDPANFKASFYSFTKGMVENVSAPAVYVYFVYTCGEELIVLV